MNMQGKRPGGATTPPCLRHVCMQANRVEQFPSSSVYALFVADECPKSLKAPKKCKMSVTAGWITLS